MLKLKQLLAGSNSAVALLIVAALGAVAFTALAGGLFYRNMQRHESADKWVEHTQEVLTSLQRASLLTERVQYRTRLHLLMKDEDQLNRARQSASLLETVVVRLGALVADNPNQTENVRSLSACTGDLGKMLDSLTLTSEVPEVQIQRCQQTISRMTDQEQSLLKERTSGSERSSFALIATEIAFASVSFVAFLVLFGFLLRDALRRQRMSNETALANERLARSVNALEEQARQLELLTAARDELQLCVDVQQVYQSAVRSFSRLLPRTSGTLCIINNSRNLVETVSSWEGSGSKSAIRDFQPPESCCGLRSGLGRWRQPGVSEIHCGHFDGEPPEYYFCKPIVAHGNTMGVFYVQCQDQQAVESVNQRMEGLVQLTQLTGMAVATLNLRSKLESQSIRDSLTGLFNRRFMEISLERELSRVARKKQVLSVIMLDMDHFKTFNDTNGHAAGDAALKAIAEVFLRSVRSEDIVCRYGGEEFTIILPDVTHDAACNRAETIRAGVAALSIPIGKERHGEVTVSIGLAFYPNDGEAADLLLQRADMALYRAKRMGRNKVALFQETTPVL